MVTEHGHLNTQLLGSLAHEMAHLLAAGHQLVLVTSGAVGLGRNVLARHHATETSLTAKQAAAAVGQPLLMGMYQQLMGVYQRPVAQVLISGSDFSHRDRYLNLQATLTYLMTHGVLPVVNENDVVSAAALAEDGHTMAFSDNDHLSAILAAKLQAHTLVILTNVNGVYTANPTEDPTAQRIARIDQLADMNNLNVAGQSAMGRGGMRSKLQAAKLAAMSGVNTWIAPVTASLYEALTPEQQTCGTWVKALPDQLAARDQWIGFGSGFNGVVVLNDGAKQALLQRGASLLAVGVQRVEGQFLANQVVSLQDSEGNEIGRGVCQISQPQLDQWLSTVLPRDVEVIHRNNLVLYERYLY